jgi:hypothetical protein
MLGEFLHEPRVAHFTLVSRDFNGHRMMRRYDTDAYLRSSVKRTSRTDRTAYERIVGAACYISRTTIKSVSSQWRLWFAATPQG